MKNILSLLNNNFCVIMLVLILMALSFRWCIYRETHNREATITKDTLIHWKSKDSLNHYKINSIVTENVKSFLELKTKDKEIKELQQLVKKYKGELKKVGSVTTFSEQSRYNLKSKTEIDTVMIKSDSVYVFPRYIADFNLKGWVYGKSIASKDSTFVQLKIKNDYIVSIIPERNKWFKTQKACVEIVNKNPYSEITSISSYQVAIPKPKKLGIGFVAGYGITTQGFCPFIGVGVQYSIISF